MSLREEPWLTKAQLADRLQVSTRWIDYQRREGMPCSKWGGIVRFRFSDVERWLGERSVARRSARRIEEGMV